MKYIVKKSGKIINLEGYELDKETDDKYYFSDTKYHSAGIIVKKEKVAIFVR